MSELEIGLSITVTGFIIGFLVKEVFWRRAQKNQDDLDAATKKQISDCEEDIKDCKEKIIAIEKTILQQAIIVGNISSELVILRKLRDQDQKGLEKFVEMLQLFEKGMNEQHRSVTTQNAEIKHTLDKNNLLMQEAQNVNKELISYLKGQK